MALLSPIAVLIYIVLGIIGAIIGSRKGRGIPGFFLGLVFGPIGWIVIIFLRPGHEEAVRREAERQRVVAEAAQRNAREAGAGH